MRTSLLLVLLLIATVGRADENSRYAVVRIPSHGGSGTVIETETGRSLILTCAHCFDGISRTKPIVLDVPSPATGPTKKPGVKLLAVDYARDLALLELADGPLPYVCSVAPSSWIYPRQLLSVGYDNMTLPPQYRTATVLERQGARQWTAEKPWHGRSGGALIDEGSGYLVGVVHGYEVTGRRRGIYVSHEAVVAFLTAYGSGRLPPPLTPTRPLCPT